MNPFLKFIDQAAREDWKSVFADRRATGETDGDYYARLIERTTGLFLQYEPVPAGTRRALLDVMSLWSPQRVLDPWAGYGHLATEAAELDGVAVTALTTIPEEVGKPLFTKTPGLTVYFEDPLKCLRGMADRYDAVVGRLPLGVRCEHGDSDGSTGVPDDYGTVLLVEACRHLSDSGVAVVAISQHLMTTPTRVHHLWSGLDSLGITAIAAIDLPCGDLMGNEVMSCLVVFARSPQTAVLVGQWGESPEQKQMLLDAIRNNKQTRLTRLVPRNSYQGFRAVEIHDSLRTLSRKLGLDEFSSEQVFSDVIEGEAQQGRLAQSDNVVWVPLHAKGRAVTGCRGLSGDIGGITLVVNRDIVTGEYLASFLNSHIGDLWRSSMSTGMLSPAISAQRIRDGTIFLPPLDRRDVQQHTKQCLTRITQLRNELHELEQRIWGQPLAVEDVTVALRSVNITDRFGVWLDAMPFPVASILWLAKTDERGVDMQIKHKLHFFEAFGQLLSTVYLSALAANEAIWPLLHRKLAGALTQSGLSLERATFGTWKIACEVLAAATRDMWDKNEETVCNLYCTRNRGVLRMLMSTELVQVISECNSIRNDVEGHGGARSPIRSNEINSRLDGCIERVRGEVSEHWRDYRLVKPGAFRYKNGEFVCDARVLLGTRTPFPIAPIRAREAMEDGEIYCKDDDYERGLRLLPLIKVMPSPRTEENACYFFNRVQATGVRLLSYHYESESEVVDSFKDVAEVISRLTGT